MHDVARTIGMDTEVIKFETFHTGRLLYPLIGNLSKEILFESNSAMFASLERQGFAGSNAKVAR